MAGEPRISLEHWRSLLAVVDAGGYAHAAAVLHKSQSAVTYAVQKMESLLGVKIFEVIGRKAHLTSTGEVLYRRAKALLDEAIALEGAAATLASGWEAELRLSVEIIFPTWLLLQCFARFAEERPHQRGGPWRLMRPQVGREGSARAEFGMQLPQSLHLIDVVPGRQDMNRQADLAGPLQGLGGDALGAPIDVLEQTPVRSFQTEQIVAAVR